MTDRPNIVLVTIDSLRADHCGCYGYGKRTTPTLDAMARDGIIFEHAIAPGPSTPASLPATFTGNYPLDSTDRSGLAGTRDQFRTHLDRFETFAERLTRRGYTTAGFTPNPWTCRHFGFDDGFDHFQDFLGSDRSSGIWERMLENRGSKPLTALRFLISWLQQENVFKPWPSFCDEVLAWTETASEPYFLWVFLMDIHFPYLSGASSRTQARWRMYEANLRLYLERQTTPYPPRVHDQLVTAYDDAIRYTDRCLARLRDTLNDAVHVVHADHGEGFGEHGTYGHHDQLYDVNVRVPLVVSDGGQGIGEKRISAPTSTRSMPTLLCQIADNQTPPSVTDDAVLTRTRDGSKTALRGRDWKYVRNGNADTFYSVADGERAPVTDGSPTEAVAEWWRTRVEHERERGRLAEAADVTGRDGAV